MATYEKFVWIHHVRGLTSAEARVLGYLHDRADAGGHVARLYSRTISNHCELLRRRVFQVLASLEAKQFISRGRRRAGTGGQGAYVSNEYFIDLSRNHPPDVGEDRGSTDGRVLLGVAAAEIDDPRLRTEDVEGADAFYSADRRVLTLWLERGEACGVFFENRSTLQSAAKDWAPRLSSGAKPPISFEFLHPKGQVSTAAPRNRGKADPTRFPDA